MAKYEELFSKDYKFDFTEFNKLISLLISAGFYFSIEPFKVGEAMGRKVTLYKSLPYTPDNEIDDAVIHSFSHGAEYGLLETFRANDCYGFETAEQVFKKWCKMI